MTSKSSSAAVTRLSNMVVQTVERHSFFSCMLVKSGPGLKLWAHELLSGNVPAKCDCQPTADVRINVPTIVPLTQMGRLKHVMRNITAWVISERTALDPLPAARDRSLEVTSFD